LTEDLRTSLSISLRKKAKAFVSRLSRRFVMFRKKMLTNEELRNAKKFENERNCEEKWNYYDFTYKSTCLRKAQLLNEWLNIAFDEQ
jgi:hypothetical protein